MEIDHTCANPSCQCHVAQAGEYCCDACEQQAEDGRTSVCPCGHVDCGTSTPETHGVPDQT